MSDATTTVFESTDGMSEACAGGLRHLLVACADTKLLLGYHYGEWTFGTPELEAAVASCSLAQGELGHVRLLHAILAKHFEDDADALVDRRAASDFANVGYLDRPITDWAGFVAMNYVIDLGVTRVLHAMRDSAFKPLHMSVDKMLDEERYHLHHGRGWFRTLAARGGDIKAALERQAEVALRSMAEWLGPPDDAGDRALVEAGVKRMDNGTIFRALCDDVERFATSVGARVPATSPSDFAAWTPTNRRLGGGGPDEEILFHLRGTKNEIFKLN